MRPWTGIVPFLTLLCVSGSGARAEVVLRNGNFVLKRLDVEESGGLGIKFERAYNALNGGYQGIFGPGWSSTFETHRTPGPEGGIILHSHGGGERIRFRSGAAGASVDASVSKIFERAKTTQRVAP